MDQEALLYNKANDEMIALISAKNSSASGRLSVKQAELIYTACYDIDRFRNEAFGQGSNIALPKFMEVPVSSKSDDMEMLKFGVAFAVKCITGQTF